MGRREVLAFEHLMVRVMSLLFRASLQQLADMEDENFESLGVDGISEEHLNFLAEGESQPEVVLQWVQRLILTNVETGVLTAPPPIVSRVFQELSNGIVEVQAARCWGEIKFPFPYAQMISCFLLLHWIALPLI